MATTTLDKSPAKSTIKADILQVMKTIEGFSLLLSEENRALKDLDFQKVDSLQLRKRAFATQYNDIVVNLASRGAEVMTLDKATRDALVKARAQFSTLLKDNMRTLELVKRSTQRLADRILETARSTVTDERQTHYSAKGQVQSYKSSSLSTKINESL